MTTIWRRTTLRYLPTGTWLIFEQCPHLIVRVVKQDAVHRATLFRIEGVIPPVERAYIKEQTVLLSWVQGRFQDARILTPTDLLTYRLEGVL